MNNEILNKLIAQDDDFSEAKFKSKVENTFVQIKLSICTGRTEKIKHFVNEETYSKIVNKVESDINKNQIQLYDELNVANIQITNIEENDECFIIEVNLLSKALEYLISRDTKKFISGNRDTRVERQNRMVFSKRKNAKDMEAARKCPACGANIDVNKDGHCSYCGATFNLVNYDWIITNMDI